MNEQTLKAQIEAIEVALGLVHIEELSFERLQIVVRAVVRQKARIDELEREVRAWREPVVRAVHANATLKTLAIAELRRRKR